MATTKITVNDNGDIYVKLTYNDIMHGAGGTAAIRDQDHDGKADIIAYFGDYKDEGGLPAGIRIYNGYLYTTTVRNIFRNKLSGQSLIPDRKTDTIFTDTEWSEALQKEMPGIKINALDSKLQHEAFTKLFDSTNIANVSAFGLPPVTDDAATSSPVE